MADEGAFTADLSQALLGGEADVVVHSFKDMPIEMPAGTRIAGALPRADPRDVLLFDGGTTVTARPEALTDPVIVAAPRLVAARDAAVTAAVARAERGDRAGPGQYRDPVRKLVEGEAHGLVVAKAALDRLLTFGPPFDREAGDGAGIAGSVLLDGAADARVSMGAGARRDRAGDSPRRVRICDDWLAPISVRVDHRHGERRTPRTQ